MFVLREHSRRRFCRWAFVALCLAPTSAVLGVGIARRWPSVPAAYAEAASRELGLRTSIGSVAYPRPGLVVYHDVDIYEGLDSQPLVRCPVLEMAEIGSGVALRAPQIELRAQDPTRLGQFVEQHLTERLTQTEGPVRILADQLTWHSGSRSQTFSELNGQFGATTQGAEATLAFRLAGDETSEPASLRIVMRRPTLDSTSRERTLGVTLQTGGVALPCDTLFPTLDCAAWLGTRATLRGVVWANLVNGRWQGEISGQLAQIELESLVSQHFPHTLGGTAQVQLERAIFDGPRLVEAAGSVTSMGGTISRSLVQAGRGQLHFDTTAPHPPREAIIRYQRLAFDFMIDQHGLKLSGRCPGPARGTLLADDEHALWTQPAIQPQPVAALLRTLAPGNEILVPAAESSELLMRHLPLPPLVSPSDPDGREPEPRAKLRVGTQRRDDFR